MQAEFMAKLFHETYEKLAPDFGYKTREASAKPWFDVPENNRKLMIAVAGKIISIQKKMNAEVFPKLLEALRPFANFACDDWQSHGCYNCIAKQAVTKAENN